MVLAGTRWRRFSGRISLHVTRDVRSDDASGNLWARRPLAGVDAVVMEKTGCRGDATMNSAIIAVTVVDERWDADGMVVATRCT